MTSTAARLQLPGWLVLNVVALAASLAHTLVDHHLGLYGPSSTSMSPLQATDVALTCLVVSWWILSLVATTGPARPGLSGAVVLALVWAFLANGVAAIAAAPPPADAFPFQDLAHLLSTVFGALAAATTWRELRHGRDRWNWTWAGVAIVLMAGLFVAQVTLSGPNR